MTKIEELAHSFAMRQWGKPVHYTVYESEDMLKKFCKEVMAMSLADRLTDAEKEMVRKEYADTFPDDFDRGIPNLRVANVLESIFGKEFFKNKTDKKNKHE